MNIKDLDLNLLLAMDVLLDLKNVSHAAQSYGVTQPAMSNILSRLRKAFSDDLLVKVGREMSLTPKAQELASPLKEILRSIQSQILESEPFDPAVTPYHFKLGFHDYEQLVIHSHRLPPLLTQFPKITLEHITPSQMHPAEELTQGKLDFATGPTTNDRAGIIRKKLFSDDFVCLADKRNKVLKKEKLTLRHYTQLEHIFIAPHGGLKGQADEILKGKKLSRFVRMSVSNFSITPWLIIGTDLIVTLPRRAAAIFTEQHKNLVQYECPILLDSFDIYLSWHERYRNSPPHQWLKDWLVNH